LIAVGFLSNFFGGALFHIVLAVVVGTTVFGLVLILGTVFGLMDAFIKDDVSVGYYFIAIGVFLLGVGLAFLVAKVLARYPKFGPPVLGAIGGFYLGVYIYNIALSYIWENTYFMLITGIAASIGTTIYSFKFGKTLTVPMTSFVGSYLLLNGVNTFIGGFNTKSVEDIGDVDPNDVADARKKIFGIPATTLYYIGGYFLLLVIGIGFQRYKGYQKKFEDEFYEEDEKADEDYASMINKKVDEKPSNRIN